MFDSTQHDGEGAVYNKRARYVCARVLVLKYIQRLRSLVLPCLVPLGAFTAV